MGKGQTAAYCSGPALMKLAVFDRLVNRAVVALRLILANPLRVAGLGGCSSDLSRLYIRISEWSGSLSGIARVLHGITSP